MTAPTGRASRPTPRSCRTERSRPCSWSPSDGGAPRRLGPGSGTGRIAAGPARGVGVARPDLEHRISPATDKPAQLVNARGSASGLTWSPDGTMIAFTSNRGTHSYIGVFTLASRELRYVDPSLDRDGNRRSGRRWRAASPGSVRPRRRGRACSRHGATADEPWSMRVADVKTGEAREVWKARRRATAAHSRESWPTASCYWGAGDRLVFPWEKDGWLHLYSVPARGGAATLLTPGDLRSRIRQPRARPVATMIYNSNHDDIDRRHVWSVPVDGSAKPAAITQVGHRVAAGGRRATASPRCSTPTRQLPPHAGGGERDGRRARAGRD